ncbi:MAG: diacylglycerol kinase family protein [Actinomycetes bacterium]
MPGRVAAVLGLVCLVVGVALLIVSVIAEFPRGLFVAALLVFATLCGWQGLIRPGRSRWALWVVAVLLFVGAVAVVVVDGIRPGALVGLALLVLGVAVSKRVFSVSLSLPAAPRPTRAVVVYNVKSGGGKAVSNNLAEEARRRGITPREFQPGEDWEQVVRDLVAGGADGLMAAGGDGTQALVATIAAEHDLPFACIPAGTRNHFALDLGVDRDDVVGALDAFVDGGEKRVDLGEVGGRVFVNNVSFGLYAEAVQRQGYRDAKIRTLLDTVPAVMAPGDGGAGRQLRWISPDGTAQSSAAVILVSNNVYRLGKAIGSGTRPRMDAGELGVAVMGAPSPSGHRQPLQQWATPEFVIESDGEVPLGVDGEALMMPTPLTLRIRPGVLRVRIAPQHPGASPAYAQPTGFRDAMRRLVRIVGGTDPALLG